jgi:hypothetical protein
VLPVAGVDSVAERNRFAGVVSVEWDGDVLFAKAYDLADRASH